MRRISGLKILVVMLVCACITSTSFFVSSSVAQVKYSPEHPDVVEMVDRALASLREIKTSKVGEKTLIALAIVEAGKRYNGEVPRSDSVVQDAISKILETIPGDGRTVTKGRSIINNKEVYYPCLALILLAEVDAKKYKNDIKLLIENLEVRQRANGAYGYGNVSVADQQQPGDDVSQTQYVGLAFYVAKHHGFSIKPEVVKKTLSWMIAAQQPGGFWVYHVDKNYRPMQKETPLSIHAAGIGTTYLLADILQLKKRSKSMASTIASQDIGLPKTVSLYVKPIDGKESLLNETGPIVSFDNGKLGSSTSGGNAVMANNFTPSPDYWTFYYLYALERYAYFREQADGEMGSGSLKTWYDQGVDFLKAEQRDDTGMFINKAFPAEKSVYATSFAVLFLVRSSEVISLPSTGSQLLGGIGFESNTQLRVVGTEISSIDAEKDLGAMLDALRDDGKSKEEMARLTKSLKQSIREFKNQDGKTRGETKAFLRTMISANSYYRRVIAVRFLAGEQDMDNVPALIYALGDPDFRICIEAHDGLRLISRRIDSLQVTETTRINANREKSALTPEEVATMRSEFYSIKKQWSDWFLKIRPSAEFLD